MKLPQKCRSPDGAGDIDFKIEGKIYTYLHLLTVEEGDIKTSTDDLKETREHVPLLDPPGRELSYQNGVKRFIRGHGFHMWFEVESTWMLNSILLPTLQIVLFCFIHQRVLSCIIYLSWMLQQRFVCSYKTFSIQMLNDIWYQIICSTSLQIQLYYKHLRLQWIFHFFNVTHSLLFYIVVVFQSYWFNMAAVYVNCTL